jgi:hypothetical protein
LIQTIPSIIEQGTGGKANDKFSHHITEFDKSHYVLLCKRQKKRNAKKTKQREEALIILLLPNHWD